MTAPATGMSIARGQWSGLVVAGTQASTRYGVVDHAPPIGIGHEEPGIGSKALDCTAIA